MPKKPKVALKQFGTGALKSPPDPRDYVFRLAIRGVNQPFDWELGFDIELVRAFRERCKTEKEFFGTRGRDGWGVERYKEIVDYCKKNSIKPVKFKAYNQNGSGSCVGQAGAKYLTVLDLIEMGIWDDNSAKDLYEYIFQPGGGAFPRDAVARMVEIGVGKEKLVPSYNNGKPPTEAFMQAPHIVTPELEKQRKQLQAKGYFKIEHGADFMDRFAWAMLLNFGVFFSVNGDDDGAWQSLYPKVATADWGHMLYGGKAGIKNKEPHIGHQNSWGSNIGDNGWQWLNKMWFQEIGANPPWSGWHPIEEAWTIQDKSNLFDTMQTNSKLIKIVYPDGKTEINVGDPAINPQGLISMTRNRAMDIPLKPDQYGTKDNDVDWSKLKIDYTIILTGKGKSMKVKEIVMNKKGNYVSKDSK